MPFQNATREDLRIGSYIKIDGSWFSHPFSKNAFKISSQKELTTLRSLRNINILYDPTQSDPLPSAEIEADDLVRETNLLESNPAYNPNTDQTDADTEHLRVSRQLVFTQRREKLKEAEKVYNNVLKQNKTSLREVTAGYAMGVRKAEELVSDLGDILQKGTLVSLLDLMGTSDINDEFHCHSLNVAMLSMIIGQGLQLSQEMISMLGIGALFHDIGELEEVGQWIPKTGKKNQSEQQFMRQHPLKGKTKLEKGFGIPEPSLQAIAQHHERLNGSGYPLGLKEGSIHLAAQIVMIADTYEELCNRIQREKSLTPHEALCTIFAKRQKEFLEEAVVVFIQNLGIYPPGTLVELSEGSIGMVCSINRIDRMCPTVMLYSADLSRDEAIMLDLAEDRKVSITRSLRPKDVPLRIWEYLNPRGIISYFACSEEPTVISADHTGKSNQHAEVQT